MRRTRASMRVVGVVMAAALASGCGHIAPAINNDTATVPDVCHVDDHCPGGSGTADAALSIAVASAMVGILGVAIYRRISDAL